MKPSITSGTINDHMWTRVLDIVTPVLDGIGNGRFLKHTIRTFTSTAGFAALAVRAAHNV